MQKEVIDLEQAADQESRPGIAIAAGEPLENNRVKRRNNEVENR